MLDWEMENLGYDIIPLILLPILPEEDLLFAEGQQIQNYVYTKTAEYESRKIFSIFWNQFY